MQSTEQEVVELLNRIVELELAGAVRYTQYSLMIFGHARIPIMSWMREQAAEALRHATEAGEEITTHWRKSFSSNRRAGREPSRLR